MKKIILALFVSMALNACAQKETEKVNISVKEAIPLIENKKDLVLLDVRTLAEVEAGKMDGCEHIDVLSADFNEKLAALDKTKPYLVYCKSGGRSARAVKIMQEKGFMEVYNLEGGFTAWNAKNTTK